MFGRSRSLREVWSRMSYEATFTNAFDKDLGEIWEAVNPEFVTDGKILLSI